MPVARRRSGRGLDLAPHRLFIFRLRPPCGRLSSRCHGLLLLLRLLRLLRLRRLRRRLLLLLLLLLLRWRRGLDRKRLGLTLGEVVDAKRVLGRLHVAGRELVYVSDG